MEDSKAETIRAYDGYAGLFDQRFEEHFNRHLIEQADYFLSQLPGRRILDLGCGSGNHAAYFQKCGYEVFGIDLSPAMVEICRRKGLRAEVRDMEELDFPDASFDGVWAYASLLHLRKTAIPGVIAALTPLIRRRGILAVSFKKGRAQGFEEHERFPGVRRWFTRVELDEILDWCDKGFDPIRSRSIKASERSTFIHVMFRRSI